MNILIAGGRIGGPTTAPQRPLAHPYDTAAGCAGVVSTPEVFTRLERRQLDEQPVTERRETADGGA
ncbi:hypothetical protein ACFWIA_02230 [Streptomyces sp. NPDC127068]|uniref:hypothetical protein n=1 Tax=Streptomyces sp. NPDC127068 TaxID=3347127 RepID=UPI003665676C